MGFSKIKKKKKFELFKAYALSRQLMKAHSVTQGKNDVCFASA